MRSQNASSVSVRQTIASAYASAAFWRSSYFVDFSKLSRSLTWSSMTAPLVVARTERRLPQYSHSTERETYRRHSSFSEWSSTPFLKISRHEFAKNQKQAGTCARTAELSGRG